MMCSLVDGTPCVDPELVAALEWFNAQVAARYEWVVDPHDASVDIAVVESAAEHIAGLTGE